MLTFTPCRLDADCSVSISFPLNSQCEVTTIRGLRAYPAERSASCPDGLENCQRSVRGSFAESESNEPEMGVDKSGERIRKMFGEISPRYDFCNHFLSGGVDYYWRWRTVRTVRPSGDAPILDVCTGTGDLALAYWKKSAGPVVGADFTHEMLELANVKRSQRKPRDSQPRPAFVEADAQSLPFQDDSFQIVSVAFGLRNVSDTARGLSEMARVCRSGGHVVVLEFSLPTNRLFRAFYLWYFKTILPRIGQIFARNKESAYNYLPDSVSEFPAGRQLATLMEQQGLTNAKWKPLTFGIATLYWAQKP